MKIYWKLNTIYFYIAKSITGRSRLIFVLNELRSSVAPDVDKIVYGSKVRVLDGENLTIRSLVDHSIVESFAQGGRRVITSRIYPTKAIDGAARVFLVQQRHESQRRCIRQDLEDDLRKYSPVPLGRWRYMFLEVMRLSKIPCVSSF
ncbi:UNVERIFIED_CONTAM: Beta-fructofuranosidase, soluble isoenzyme I [Sesamum angustifolium]|uniref:Beta-fructofuranosidase, soluble isoenzyme I n=1 Tax=Sesamum angustifolium TaxID=2727405 RepID=A0AAW2PT32_9LAMI